MTEWIVIEQSAWMNERGFGITYGWDGMRFRTKKAAISHGFKSRDSDDFNVATLQGETLTGFYYMDKDMDEPETLVEIAEQNGFNLASAA